MIRARMVVESAGAPGAIRSSIWRNSLRFALKNFFRFVGVPVLAVWAATAALAQSSPYQPDPNWQVPAEAAAKSNPLAAKPEAAAGGQKLFRRHCAECHGENGQGLKKAADFHNPAVQQQSDGALFWKITNGNPDRGMPSFSRLPELQRWQLVLYLRRLAPEPKSSP